MALGVWGAVGGFGAAAGLLLGGVLTDTLGWEWIFFVNVPVGAAALAAAPRLLAESRDARVRSFDALGAVLVTAGLSSLVYAITQAEQAGWLAARTVGFFAAALSLLVGFVVWERRHPEPLMRLAILRTRTLAGANVASLILNITTLSTFLMLTLYMQQVLGSTADADRLRVPRDRGHGDRLVDRRGAARHARGRQAGAPRRAVALTGALRVPDADLGRRLVRHGSAAGLPADGASGSASRSCRPRSPRWRVSSRARRARLGADQHVAADRRRPGVSAPLSVVATPRGGLRVGPGAHPGRLFAGGSAPSVPGVSGGGLGFFPGLSFSRRDRLEQPVGVGPRAGLRPGGLVLGPLRELRLPLPAQGHARPHPARDAVGVHPLEQQLGGAARDAGQVAEAGERDRPSRVASSTTSVRARS